MPTAISRPALEGDAVATERHLKAYFGVLIRLKLRSRLLTRATIDALERKTFVRLFAVLQAQGRWPLPEGLGALVNSVCKHVLQEHERAHGAEEATARVAERLPMFGPSSGYETRSAVRKVLCDLSERDRRLLQSVLLEGRDPGAACAELGLPRAHLLELVHRARHSLGQ